LKETVIKNLNNNIGLNCLTLSGPAIAEPDKSEEINLPTSLDLTALISSIIKKTKK
jgi:hypothetical protein